MTYRVSKVEEDKIRSFLNQYLEGRSETFKNKVYELVIRYGWDVNDPAFVILLATGQMEAILETFPEQFEADFLAAMQKQQQAFVGYQRWFEARQGELKSYIQGLEVQQAQSQALLQEKIEGLNQAIESQQQWHLAALNQALAVAQNHRSQLFEEVKVQLTTVEHEFIQSVANHSHKLIAKIVAIIKRQVTRELISLTVGLGGMMFIAGFVFGAFTTQAYVNRFSDNPWAVQLWQWNQANYRECVRVGKTTCNFRLSPPK
jgi:hypothetical protein